MIAKQINQLATQYCTAIQQYSTVLCTLPTDGTVLYSTKVPGTVQRSGTVLYCTVYSTVSTVQYCSSTRVLYSIYSTYTSTVHCTVHTGQGTV